MFKLIIVNLSITMLLPAADNKLTPIANTRYNHALPAKADRGDIFIAAREMLVDVVYADGPPRKGALLILYDLSSGRYLWEFGPVRESQKASTMTSGYGTIGLAHVPVDRFVLFAFGHPNLIVHESTEKASGIEDAEARSLVEATERLPAKLMHKVDDRVLINLGTLLPHEFFMACSGCSGPSAIKMLNVTHRANTWEVILQGQWQEKITLNQKYEVTGHARIN